MADMRRGELVLWAFSHHDILEDRRLVQDLIVYRYSPTYINSGRVESVLGIKFSIHFSHISPLSISTSFSFLNFSFKFIPIFSHPP
jgi:hypothetical protein